MALIQIQLRHDVATNWTSINPVMLSGEVGIETDTNKFKFGNGVDTWTALPYAAGEGGGTSLDVRHDGVIVVTSSNLDFRHGLDVVESVTGRAAIDVDETELSFVAAPIAVGRSFSLSGVLSPAQITADQNNYAPTGIADANFLRVSSDAARTITGISATATTGRVLLVVNTGNFAITLAHNSSSSLDANKMFFADNVDFILAPNSYAILVYDQSSLK